MQITTRVLVDAICGRGFPSMVQADHYTRAGLAKFNGNQWNECWAWDRDQLAYLPIEQLLGIYRDVGGVVEAAG